MITRFSNPIFYAKRVLPLFFVFFLFGCESSSELTSTSAKSPSPEGVHSAAPKVTAEQNNVENLRSEKYKAENEKLQQCQSQLEALKVMAPVKYSQMHKSFDYLMNGAAQYSNIRQKINADTQDTVDALYRYRANLLCAEISQALLDGLTRRGEARQ